MCKLNARECLRVVLFINLNVLKKKTKYPHKNMKFLNKENLNSIFSLNLYMERGFHFVTLLDMQLTFNNILVTF